MGINKFKRTVNFAVHPDDQVAGKVADKFLETVSKAKDQAMKKPTLYQQHKAKWKDCTRCLLFRKRRRVVLARGKLPCDILLVGEAPGASENVLGKPFCGPAGKLLDYIMLQAWGEDYTSYAITNLVGCMPLDSDRLHKKSKSYEPPLEAVKACWPRLEEFIAIAKPDAIVAVGLLAKKYLAGGQPKYAASIVHPAAILRADVSQRGLAIQQSIITLRDVRKDLVPF